MISALNHQQPLNGNSFMKMMKYLVVCLVVVVSSNLCAQGIESPQLKQYQDAKAFYVDGKYNLAMEAFKPLIQAEDNNPYTPYASFYFALSAYNEGYLPLAKNMLLQIKKQSPKWSRTPEVNIWLAKIHFENKDYNSALQVLSSVESDFTTKLKKYEVKKIDDIDQMKELYTNHSDDNVIAEELAYRISQQSLASRDQLLLTELIERHDLDHKKLDVSVITKTVYKDEYHVALLLPFMVENLEPNERRKVNQFVLDFYEGIKVAVDTLSKSGVDIELHAYDTKRDTIETARILKKEELKGMDLIIGPLFTSQIEIVKEFAYRNKINLINPFYSNSEIIGNNPFSFLYKPTSETVGEQAAEYVINNARNKVGIIYYGDGKQDEVMAQAYKARIEKDSFNIITYKRIKKDSSRSILDMLLISDGKIKEASTEEAKEKLTIGLDSVGHIFVASNDDLISTKVISAVETRGDSIMVVGSAAWLDLPAISYETYLRLNTVLYAPAYISTRSNDYDAFRNHYLQKHRKTPPKYAEEGYELMMLLGKSLDEYGKYFQLGWGKKNNIPGAISFGYNYQNSNSNTLVPILTFEDGDMRTIIKMQEDSDGDKNK